MENANLISRDSPHNMDGKNTPKILVIDSVREELFVALIAADGGEAIVSRTCSVQRAHDRNLNKLTRDLIDRAGAFAVVVGPGSWTGSRVGVVAVKSYALATGRPVVALRACENRADLFAEVREKFAAGDFTPARDLAPFYNSEFFATPTNFG